MPRWPNLSRSAINNSLGSAAGHISHRIHRFDTTNDHHSRRGLVEECAALRKRVKELEEENQSGKTSLDSSLSHDSSDSDDLMQQEVVQLRKDLMKLENEKATMEFEFMNQLAQMTRDFAERGNLDINTKEGVSIENETTSVAEMEQVKCELQQAENELEAIRKDLDALQIYNGKLETEKAALLEDNTNIRLELHNESKVINSLNDAMAQNEHHFKSKVEKLEKQIQEKDMTIATKDTEIAGMSVSINQIQGENVTLVKELEEIRNQSDGVKSLQEEKASLQEEKASLQEEKASLQEEKASLQEEKATLQKEKVTLQEEKATLQEEKATLQKEKVSLQEEKASLEDEKERLSEEIVIALKQLDSNNVSLKDDARRAEEKADELQDLLDALRVELQAIKKMHRDEIYKLEERVATNVSENNQLRKKLNERELELKAAVLNHEILVAEIANPVKSADEVKKQTLVKVEETAEVAQMNSTQSRVKAEEPQIRVKVVESQPCVKVEEMKKVEVPKPNTTTAAAATTKLPPVKVEDVKRMEVTNTEVSKDMNSSTIEKPRIKVVVDKSKTTTMTPTTTPMMMTTTTLPKQPDVANVTSKQSRIKVEQPQKPESAKSIGSSSNSIGTTKQSRGEKKKKEKKGLFGRR